MSVAQTIKLNANSATKHSISQRPPATKLGNSDADLKLQAGWLNILRSGGLPNFSIHRRNGKEIPLSDWIRNAGTAFRACNLIAFIGVSLLILLAYIFLQYMQD
jgi:hypothetical protein